MIYEPGNTNWDLYIDFHGGAINIWRHSPEFMKAFVMYCRFDVINAVI